MTREELRAMTPAESKAAYIQLCESKGYRRRDISNSIICMVDQHYVTEFDTYNPVTKKYLYDRVTHLWDPSVRGAGQAVICVSA